MTTTLDWLKTKDWAEISFSLVFDGFDLVYTSANELTGAGSITAAFSATDWTVVKGGLDIIGEISESIDLFNPQVKPNRLSFRCLDYDGTLAQTLFAPDRRNSGDSTTYITQDITAAATSLAVQNTSGFASSGVYYLGQEAGAYGSKTSTTLATLTRGKWALFGTNSTPTRYPRYHRMMPDAYGQRAIAPRVTNFPGTFYNRMVGLYVHHREGGVWSTAANSLLLWAGRLKDWGESGDGWMELVATSVHELFASSVFSDQFTANMGNGLVSTHAVDRAFRVHSDAIDSSGATNYGSSTTTNTLGTLGTRYTWAEIASLIQEQLSTWQAGGQIHSRHRWSVSLERKSTSDDAAARIVIRLELIGATFPANTFQDVAIGMSKKWWELLGADLSAGDVTIVEDANGLSYPLRRLKAFSTTALQLIMERPCVDYMDPTAASGSLQGDEWTIDNIRGTWLTQPIDGLSLKYQANTGFGSAEGFVSVGSNLVAIADFVPDADPRTGVLLTQRRVGPDVDGANDQLTVYAGAGGAPLVIRQVWYEVGRAGTLLLRLILSTGTAGHNHATYDVYPVGFGLGIPASLVDIPSFLALEDRWELTLEKPKPFKDFIESILAATGRYLVWKNGKLTVTPPGFDSPYVEGIVELNETNKGKTPPKSREKASTADRSPISYAPDTIINRIVLKYGVAELTKIETPSIGDRTRASVLVVEDIASISDFGQRKTVEIEASGMLEPKSAIDYVIAPALAYFSRPMGQIERSINGKLLYITPSDIAKLTDNTLIDPRTGLRGIAGLAGWVRSRRFDFKTGTGKLSLAFLPSHPASRYTTWAPSGSIANYVAATKIVTLNAHGFSRSTEPVDASRFAAGDKVAIIEISPVTAASPTRHTATVDSVNAGANTVTLTSDPTGGAGLDFVNKDWVLEYDVITNCQTSQQDKAFIANDTAQQPATGLLADDARLYAGSHSKWFATFDTSAIDYSTTFVRPSDQASLQGRPYSAHTAYFQLLSCNNLLGISTCNICINDILPTEVTHNATSWKLVYCVMVPLFGVDQVQGGLIHAGSHGIRKLRGKVWLRRTAAAGTDARVRITSSNLLPFDITNALDVTWPAGVQQTTKTETATTLTWSTVFEIEPMVVWADPMPYTFIGVEITETGGATCGFRGISMQEKPLP